MKSNDSTLKTFLKTLSSQRLILIVGIFLVAIISAVLYTSYSYYTVDSSNLIVGSEVSLSNADLELRVYEEKKDESGKGINEYERIYYIPQESYNYNESLTTCTDGVNINSFENGTFDISATKKGFCRVYFDADEDVIPTGNFHIYIQKDINKDIYSEVGVIPNNQEFIINESLTTCQNVTYENHSVIVSSSNEEVCDIYLDIQE